MHKLRQLGVRAAAVVDLQWGRTKWGWNMETNLLSTTSPARKQPSTSMMLILLKASKTQGKAHAWASVTLQLSRPKPCLCAFVLCFRWIFQGHYNNRDSPLKSNEKTFLAACLYSKPQQNFSNVSRANCLGSWHSPEGDESSRTGCHYQQTRQLLDATSQIPLCCIAGCKEAVTLLHCSVRCPHLTFVTCSSSKSSSSSSSSLRKEKVIINDALPQDSSLKRGTCIIRK